MDAVPLEDMRGQTKLFGLNFAKITKVFILLVIVFLLWIALFPEKTRKKLPARQSEKVEPRREKEDFELMELEWKTELKQLSETLKPSPLVIHDEFYPLRHTNYQNPHPIFDPRYAILTDALMSPTGFFFKDKTVYPKYHYDLNLPETEIDASNAANYDSIIALFLPEGITDAVCISKYVSSLSCLPPSLFTSRFVVVNRMINGLDEVLQNFGVPKSNIFVETGKWVKAKSMIILDYPSYLSIAPASWISFSRKMARFITPKYREGEITIPDIGDVRISNYSEVLKVLKAKNNHFEVEPIPVDAFSALSFFYNVKNFVCFGHIQSPLTFMMRPNSLMIVIQSLYDALEFPYFAASVGVKVHVVTMNESYAVEDRIIDKIIEIIDEELKNDE